MANMLKCEYQIHPIGVDRRNPRFTWELSGSARAIGQTRYRLVVEDASGRTVWDSGEVDATDQRAVYDGSDLAPFSRYRWHVTWWDSDGTPHRSETPAEFETALFPNATWEASWISRKRPDTFQSNTVGRDPSNKESGTAEPPVLAIYLRREFEVKADVGIRRGRVFVSGIGCNEVEVNGERIGDALLDPGQTEYHELALYSVFDLDDVLVPGENAIGIILGNGRHLSAYGYGKPRATACVMIEYEDGAVDWVMTDGDWLSSHGPIRENGFFYGETIDHRIELDGWSSPGFDDTRWDRVEVLAEYTPRLQAQAMPPIRATHELTPERIYEVEPGVFVCDFGQNFSGWVRLFAEGAPGTTVSIKFSELVYEDGTLNPEPNRSAECTDRFILQGGGPEMFEPHFTYHGFRYAEISGYPGVPTPDDVIGVFVHTDVAETGTFHCSSELVNQIHHIIWWGQLSNYMSMPTDCPQRDERMGWMGDAQLTVEEALYNFDMSLAYEKYLEDIRVCQRDDGSISDVVPPYWPFYPADPAWGTAYVVITWYLYQFYGDDSVIKRYFDSIRRYVDYLSSIAENDIVTFGKYGDWCPPASTFPKKTPVAFTSTFFYYHDCLHLSWMAEIIGRAEEAATYSELAARIKHAFNLRFLGEQGVYEVVRTSDMDKSCSQTSQALALYLDMVPEKDRDAAYRQLQRSVIRTFDLHVDTGIVGTRYLFDVLTRFGDSEAAFRTATQTSYPGFGYMLTEGATTMWERWERLQGEGMNSQNHIMLGSIDAWFYRVLAGIAPARPGWATVVIKPFPPQELDYCYASVETIRGSVATSWRKANRSFMLTASIPAGVRAEVWVPVTETTVEIRETGDGDVVVWSGGASKSTVSGGGEGVQEPGYVRFPIGSGFYSFEASW